MLVTVETTEATYALPPALDPAMRARGATRLKARLGAGGFNPVRGSSLITPERGSWRTSSAGQQSEPGDQETVLTSPPLDFPLAHCASA